MKVAFLSDIHANIYALEAVLDVLEKQSVSTILVSGDMIGYYHWPRQVIDLLRSDRRMVCIKGNHEKILQEARKNESVLEKYRKKYGSAHETCLTELSDEDLDWIEELPDTVSIVCEDTSVFSSHGSLESSFEYIYPTSEPEVLIANYSSRDVTVFGHTHYPMLHCYEDKFLINPGSVGQPRDVGGLASFITLETSNRMFQFHRCRFNTENIRMRCQKEDPQLKYLWEIMER
ncbi:MAG: metallophosphoesterase family protein [Candidatus Azotimanducaceae bacterium]